jgi:hypothetical protein
MAKYLSWQQNKWANFQVEDSAYDFGTSQTKPIIQSVGGIYRAALPTYTDGDAAMNHYTVDGKLYVQNSSDIQLGAVEIKDGDSDTRLDVITQDAAFGTATNGLAMFGKYQATPTTYSDNDAAPILLDANGRIVLSSDIEIGAVEIKNSSSDDRVIVKTGSTFAASDLALGVADANVLAALTGSTSGVYAEDTAHVSGDKAVAILTKRTDTAASSADTTEDYATLNTDSLGKLWVTGTQLEDVAHTTGDKGVFVLSKRTDTAASSAGTDGDYAAVNSDSLGHVWSREGYAPAYEDNSNGVAAMMIKPLASAAYSSLLFQNLGANATLNVKASAGNVFSVKCHNLNAASRYFQLHNTATVPGGAAVPLMTWLVPAGSEIVIGTDFFTQAGLHLNTGIAFAFSTTEATYTAGTAGDQMTHVVYI